MRYNKKKYIEGKQKIRINLIRIVGLFSGFLFVLLIGAEFMLWFFFNTLLMPLIPFKYGIPFEAIIEDLKLNNFIIENRKEIKIALLIIMFASYVIDYFLRKKNKE